MQVSNKGFPLQECGAVWIINGRFGGTCRLNLQGSRNTASEEKC
jgi:hypothetical protein